MIRSSLLSLWNLEILSFVHLPIALMEKKCHIHDIFLYFPIKNFFSLYIRILFMYLVIQTVMEILILAKYKLVPSYRSSSAYKKRLRSR